MNMRNTYLDFEQPLGELEGKIEQLRYVQADSAVDISEEIGRLQQKSQTLTKDIYSKLTPWQTSMVARHPQRPYTLDYVREIFTDFHELHGDRMYADDLSIVGGMARFNGTPCMVLGHQKGRDTKERAARNFGMPRPEGYRKAMRLMRLAILRAPTRALEPKNAVSQKRLGTICMQWLNSKCQSSRPLLVKVVRGARLRSLSVT
jgi:acetyl-CoA carboxylase carboxyl transferase subunit alpha